jgi:serine/threonine protein kinase
MLSGYAPFTHVDRNVQKIQSLILENKVTYPLAMSSEAKDLISRLLKTNPKERLGVNGYAELKSHPFFA